MLQPRNAFKNIIANSKDFHKINKESDSSCEVFLGTQEGMCKKWNIRDKLHLPP